MSEETLPTILRNYVREGKNGEKTFDFERIVPIGDVPDWYKQRIQKWGTKWVGYDLNIGKSIMDFFTAWSPPIPVIKKLAELHTALVFRLEYYELGNAFRGVATAKWGGGEVLLEDNCWDVTEKDYEELGFGDFIESKMTDNKEAGNALSPDSVGSG
jgi:hypothetical protein